MIWQIIHIVELLCWAIIAVSAGYVVFFSLVSLFCKKSMTIAANNEVYPPNDFLVIYPAYQEDVVICRSVEAFLQQEYSHEHYCLVVVSDQMQPTTNQWLSSQPLTLMQPTFEKSSKAKALQYAMAECEHWKTENKNRKVVILDADNVVRPDFLLQLNAVCHHTNGVIQCHRTAKNTDNDIAALDGISEEINNTIFRRAHNQIGLSSALIGSGMCFDFDWFKEHVGHLSTAVEDRELEALIMRENIYIHYAEDIYVFDEKVSSDDNFQRQRLRWMTGQVQTFFSMIPYLPQAIRKGNINYIDKTLQQMLIPRSILIILLSVLSVIMTVLVPTWSIKWWVLFVCFAIALFIAIPSRLRSRTLLQRLGKFPLLAWKMIRNIGSIDKKNKDFIHTTHDK